MNITHPRDACAINGNDVRLRPCFRLAVRFAMSNLRANYTCWWKAKSLYVSAWMLGRSALTHITDEILINSFPAWIDGVTRSPSIRSEIHCFHKQNSLAQSKAHFKLFDRSCQWEKKITVIRDDQRKRAGNKFSWSENWNEFRREFRRRRQTCNHLFISMEETDHFSLLRTSFGRCAHRKYYYYLANEFHSNG